MAALSAKSSYDTMPIFIEPLARADGAGISTAVIGHYPCPLPSGSRIARKVRSVCAIQLARRIAARATYPPRRSISRRRRYCAKRRSTMFRATDWQRSIKKIPCK